MNNAIIVFSVLIFTGCLSIPEKTNNQPNQTFYQPRIVDSLDATYEKNVFPFIIKQIKDTAAAFYYDVNKANINLSKQGLPVINYEPSDVTVGEKETGAVCADYTNHFIDNYRGLGEIYYIAADTDGTTSLWQKVKQFEKSDIIITDTMTIEDFKEQIYQWVMDYSAKNQGSRYIWQDPNGQWKTFYTQSRNGTIYWTEYQNDLHPNVPFGKEKIQINYKNYQTERSRESRKFTDQVYKHVLSYGRENKRASDWGLRWYIGSDYYYDGLYVTPMNFYIDNNGVTFLEEKTPVPTPLSHAGKKDGFFDHAWVRIIWRDMTIDIDPTWYDNGTPMRRAVEVLKQEE